jgi:hypothetical protein
VGTALTIAVFVQYAPAVLHAYRSGTVSGISRSTWGLVGVNGLIWTVYGLPVADAAVAVYGAVLSAAGGEVLMAARREPVPSAVPASTGS